MVGVSAPTRESSGRPWPPGDPRGDARVRPRSHERVASHRARPSIPKAEKNKRENWRAGANLPRSRRRVVRVLTCPRPSFRSGRCRWPGVPPACRTPTFRWTTLFSRARAGVRGRRSPIKKKSLRPFAQLKFRSPRPDRRARTCRDASVSVDPLRVRLFVRGCDMSEAELGGIPGVVRGALPRKAGECPHAASRTSNASAKSSNPRVIYLLRQTPLADPASCIFARGEASLWRTSALTRRVPSHVPSSPSLHGAPHSVRGCLIVARRGQQSLAIQSKANGKT